MALLQKIFMRLCHVLIRNMVFLFSLLMVCITNINAQSINQKIEEYVIKRGKQISPTYEEAVCTELVIKVLEHFTPLTKDEKKKVRIIVDDNIYALRLQNREEPKGVYYALTNSNKGVAITSLEEVKAGDFVQFWYPFWGHCGIVKNIDIQRNVMTLYSSYPATQGYGIQEFSIPEECYFVRLKDRFSNKL